MNILSSQRLVDNFITFTGELETNFVDIMVKNTSLQFKIQQMQEKILRFKYNFLKILSQQISDIIQDVSHRNKNQLMTYKMEQINKIDEKQKQYETKWITFQLRNILKNKIYLMKQNFNKSYQTFKDVEINTEANKIQQLNMSIKKMQKDLGLQTQQEQYFSIPHELQNSQQIKNRDFLSMMSNPSDNCSFQQNQPNFLKKFFLTNSSRSLQTIQPVRNPKIDEKKNSLKSILNKLTEKNNIQLKYCLKAFKSSAALHELSLMNQNKKQHNFVKIQTTSIKKTVSSKPEVPLIMTKSKSTKLQQKQIQSTQRIKNAVNKYKQQTKSVQKINQTNPKTNQKQKRNVVISKTKGIFQDILKQSYESFISQEK